MKTTKLLAIVALLLPVLVFVVVYGYRNLHPVITTKPNGISLQTYTSETLKAYNGVDPAKPILIGLNNYVYDVSAGKEYYQSGAAYNFLAGRDSSTELNLIGGDIIARKYPIVGVIIPN